MANPIIQEINNELKGLQEQLSLFYSNVEYLTNGRDAVKDAVIKVNHAEAHFNKRVTELKIAYNSIVEMKGKLESMFVKIDAVDFPERLTSIEAAINQTISSLDETKQQTIFELREASKTILEADFRGEFGNLKQLVKEVLQESKRVIDEVKMFEKGVAKEIRDSFQAVENHTMRISKDSTKAISDMNLPSRIDKLDANVAGILVTVQNIQGRLDIVEGNLIERLNDLKINLNSQNQISLSAINNLEQKMLAIEKSQKTKTIITWVLLAAGFAAVIILCKK
jgi:hypothetical protein